MARIASFELMAVDLPFRKPFKHAAAERSSSYSLFLKCTTDSGVVGFGESLPREYVSGETRDGAMTLLLDHVLPRLIDKKFDCLEDVECFLRDCNGKAPGEFVDAAEPQTAAWGTVDLALLDTFGRVFGTPVLVPTTQLFPRGLCYSGVLSSDQGLKLLKSALKMRIYGLRSIKMKVDRDTPENTLRLARRALGRKADIRVDANMAWTTDVAIETMKMMSKYGISSFEQPLAADDVEGLSCVVKKTGLDVMVDESLTDRDSLQLLIDKGACTSINVRISKCGGLIASKMRCEEALQAGLTVQVGCQVGESSLLSAAHLTLVTAVQKVTYAEGCFGRYLLREDPVSPLLQFGFGGRPPVRPKGPGLGVAVNEQILRRHAVKSKIIDRHG